MNSHIENPKTLVPWNKARLVGQKTPLKLKEIWAKGNIAIYWFAYQPAP
jgi:hypothetical protein